MSRRLLSSWLPGCWLAWVITGGVATVTASECPTADPKAMEWLDRMSRGLQQLSYHGVVTLQRDNDMHVMQLYHQVQGDSSLESMTQLTGQGARVERAAHPLECIHPGHSLLRIGRQLREGQCGIAEQYRFQVAEGERVAGRKAVRISIEPRDVYRFGYIMDLDQETALVLKTQMIGPDGIILEKFQFANLSYSDQEPLAASATADVVHAALHPALDSPVVTARVQRGWGVAWVPRGFTATEVSPDISGRRTYTDGLASFSVFLEDLDAEIRPGEGLVRSGGTTSYTRGMRLGGLPVLVTVIGEVPVNTARMVADSVRWVQ